MSVEAMQEDAFQVGAIVPTYRHVQALPRVVGALVSRGLPVVVVDDGNASPESEAIASLHAPDNGVTVVRLPTNGGKGAAVKAGMREGHAMGWSHALQVDADGQHDLDDADAMLALAKAHPAAVICGVPVYDESIPKARKFGREITHFWVRVETLSLEISDSMCGFRIYPLDETVRVLNREFIGNRMDFDTEILVQLNWRGLRVIEHPTRVVYPVDNTSNFRMLWDNVRISLMHTRLAVQAPFRAPLRMIRRRFLKAGG